MCSTKSKLREGENSKSTPKQANDHEDPYNIVMTLQAIYVFIPFFHCLEQSNSDFKSFMTWD